MVSLIVRRTWKYNKQHTTSAKNLLIKVAVLILKSKQEKSEVEEVRDCVTSAAC